MIETRKGYLQVECFVEFRRTRVVFRFGSKLSLLVAQVRSDDVHLNKRLEHGHVGPFKFVTGNDWKEKQCEKEGECEHLASIPLTVTLCSPELGWVNRSTWIDISPTGPSSCVGKSCFVWLVTKDFMSESVVCVYIESAFRSDCKSLLLSRNAFFRPIPLAWKNCFIVSNDTSSTAHCRGFKLRSNWNELTD